MLFIYIFNISIHTHTPKKKNQQKTYEDINVASMDTISRTSYLT